MHFHRDSNGPEHQPLDSSPGRHTDPNPPTASVFGEVDADGRLTVHLDGALLASAPIGRAAFGSLLDEIVRRRRGPVQVEVREFDGSVYRDLLTQRPEAATESSDAPVDESDDTAGSATSLLEVSGFGFVPGEEVALAPILMHTSAGQHGRVRGLVEVDAPVEEVLVFGRVSGTIQIVRTRR